jgi:lysophospholipase L1-like esterase
MLFIGDSITQGWNSYYDTLSFAWRLTLHYNANSIINGIGGAFYEPATFDKIDFDPDIVMIAYGTNDARRFKVFEDMERRVIGYLDLVKEAYGDKRVVVVSPIWRGDADMKPMGAEFDEKRKMIEREAAERGFEVISGLELVPPRAELFADTYLHPNDLGFGVYAENLIKKLERK